MELESGQGMLDLKRGAGLDFFKTRSRAETWRFTEGPGRAAVALFPFRAEILVLLGMGEAFPYDAGTALAVAVELN